MLRVTNPEICYKLTELLRFQGDHTPIALKVKDLIEIGGVYNIGIISLLFFSNQKVQIYLPL